MSPHPQSGNHDKPAVSVIIPVYNVQDWLEETLDAILAQSFTDWECVCVDDGSKDGSADIVRAYASRDARFRLISQVNAGAAAARNHGIEEARGEYLLFVDADDLPTPEMMSTCVERMRSDHSDICAFEVDIFYTNAIRPDEKCISVPVAEGEAFTSFSPQERPDEVFLQIPASPWNKMYRVEFLRRNDLRFPTTLKRSEDTPFGAMCLALAGRVSCVKATLYRYRQNRPGSQMSTLEKSSVYYCYIDAATAIWQGLRQHGLLPTFAVGALRLSLGNSLYYHDYLKPGLKMWLATRRLKRFLKQSLRELRSLGVEVPPGRLAEINDLVNAFAQRSDSKCREWLSSLPAGKLFFRKK